MGYYETKMYLPPDPNKNRYEDLIEYALRIDGYEYARNVWCTDDYVEKLYSFKHDENWIGSFEDLSCCLFLLQRQIRWIEQDGSATDLRRDFLSIHRTICELWNNKMQSGNDADLSRPSLNKIKRVVEYHKDYSRYFLGEKLQKKDTYLKDSKEALFFIFSLCFYQGRRDEVSKVFEKRARLAFESYLSKNPNVFSKTAERLYDKATLKTKYSELEEVLQSHNVNKEGDRLMVLSLLNYSQAVANGNIVKHIVQKVRLGKVKQTYEEIDQIWSIGPKITALILRDVVYIYNIENNLEKEDYNYLQPADTWVHQIASKLSMTKPSKKRIYNNENIDITQKCLDLELNPIHFNQGAWYLGANSLKILLDKLDNV